MVLACPRHTVEPGRRPSRAESEADRHTVAAVSPDLTLHPAVAAVRAALGITPAEIANSLIFKAVDGAGQESALLVMASGGHRVDTAYLADQLGVARIERADPDFVRTHTGMAIGGVAPVGHPTPLRTVVDIDLERFESVWAAGGHAQTVFRTSYAALLAMTSGRPAAVARPG